MGGSKIHVHDVCGYIKNLNEFFGFIGTSENSKLFTRLEQVDFDNFL